MTAINKPLIGIVCCQKKVDKQIAQTVYEKYIDAVTHHGGAPILLPAEAADPTSFARIAPLLDGILLTGSYSNVAPERYHATHEESYTDLGRDELTFSLIDYSKAHDLPLLAICRGLQELNVALGGTLHPDWREVEGFFEPHLEDSSLPIEEQYAPAHDILIEPDSQLIGFTKDTDVLTDDATGHHVWRVNSLHKQCIANVAPQLSVMAKARDNLVEAVGLPSHSFMLGVQWHPESSYDKDNLSQYLFRSFIEHAQQYQQNKSQPE